MPVAGMEWEQRMAVLRTAFNYSEFAPSDLADIRAALGRCARLRMHFRELFTDADLRRPPSGGAAHGADDAELSAMMVFLFGTRKTWESARPAPE